MIDFENPLKAQQAHLHSSNKNAESGWTHSTIDGESLFVHCWPAGSEEAGKKSKDKSAASDILFVIHGMGEHGGRYAHLHEGFDGQFEKVLSMDLRGHGRSSGLRGDSPGFDQHVGDVMTVLTSLKNRGYFEGRRVFLLGHSMGGLIALRLLQTQDPGFFAGVIISAPLLGVAMPVPSWKVALGKILAKTLARIQLVTGINPSYLSHDPLVIEAYVQDRLVHDKVTPRLYFDLLNVQETVLKKNTALPVKSLFLVPLQDQVVSSPATISFFEKLQDQKKFLIEYPEFYHESLNEVGRERVFADILQWVKAHG